MQDKYVGDIGDYGKYGLLREIAAEALSLSVNWYRVVPSENEKQDDGKFTNYLSAPLVYREYDPELFDVLRKIVTVEQDRRIERLEQENMFRACCFSKPVEGSRHMWHQEALQHTSGTDVVFLDPDNGLATERMHRKGCVKTKHVDWSELKDYYVRGQSVILYQHRPQFTTKEKCIAGVMHFQREFLHADYVKLLEFPKCTNRFYFMFLHEEHKTVFDAICRTMDQKWGKGGFCREVIVEQKDAVGS